MSELTNRFKPTSLNSIKDEQQRAQSAIPFSNESNRPGFHSIEEGKNWFRVAPAHNPGEPPYRAKSTTTLECEVPEIDTEGKETGKKELKRKSIFIATQHSELKEDPILLYISFVEKKAKDEIENKDERSKFLSPINGWRGRDGKWNWGIRPSTNYVCYSWNKQGVLGRNDLYPQILDDMKKVSVSRADDNVEIVPDIFSDAMEGYPLIITKEKNDKGKFEYNVSCELPSKTETWIEFFDRNKLTDEQAIELLSKESLTELYKNVYTTRDFNLAIDGLQRFDEINKYHIFENEEFIDKISALKKLVPVYEPKIKEVEPEKINKDEPKKGLEVPLKPIDIKAEKEEISSDNIPIPKMKRIIKEYIAENYGSDYSLPDLGKDDVIKWYKLSINGDELPFDELDTKTETISEKPKIELKEDKVVKTENIKSSEDNNDSTSDESESQKVVKVKEPVISSDLKAQIELLRRKRTEK